MNLFQIFLKDEFDHMGINSERSSRIKEEGKSNDAHQMTTAETEGKNDSP